MNNKKGFTLVELLAVIAILAVLVIIALPNVLKLFNDSRAAAFKTELKSVYSAAEEQWINDNLNSSGNSVYSHCNGGTCNEKLKLDGGRDLEYYIEFNSKGKITKYYATNGAYQYKYDGPGLEKNEIDNVQLVADIIDEAQKVSIEDIESGNTPSSGPGDPTLGSYYNTSSSNYYETLSSAISEATSNQTIKVLADTEENTLITIPSNLTGFKIDFNGKTVNFERVQGEYQFINNGQLELINSGGDDGGVEFWSPMQNNGTYH